MLKSRRLDQGELIPVFKQFDQHDLHAVFFSGEFDFIHEERHQVDAAAICFFEIIGIERIGQFFEIEAIALVIDRELDVFAGDENFYRDCFGRLPFIAMDDGIGQRLGQSGRKFASHLR